MLIEISFDFHSFLFLCQTQQESHHFVASPDSWLPRPPASPGAFAELEGCHHPGSPPGLAATQEIPAKSSQSRSRPEQGQTIFGAKKVQEAEDRSKVDRTPEDAEQRSGEQDHQLATEVDGEREISLGAEEGTRGAQGHRSSAGRAQGERG